MLPSLSVMLPPVPDAEVRKSIVGLSMYRFINVTDPFQFSICILLDPCTVLLLLPLSVRSGFPPFIYPRLLQLWRHFAQAIGPNTVNCSLEFLPLINLVTPRGY